MLEQTVHKGRYSNGQQTHKEMLNTKVEKNWQVLMRI